MIQCQACKYESYVFFDTDYNVKNNGSIYTVFCIIHIINSLFGRFISLIV